MERALREEFGYVSVSGSTDHWLSLGTHFFPTILSNSGFDVPELDQQYRKKLATTSELMWNTPADGPFQYDSKTNELWTRVPLTDDAVLEKLDRVRQLDKLEAEAIRDLYFSPRLDLANFSFLFDNFTEAQQFLLEEIDEDKRWEWFQKEFSTFYNLSLIHI